jgi:hypothetical protein
METKVEFTTAVEAGLQPADRHAGLNARLHTVRPTNLTNPTNSWNEIGERTRPTRTVRAG